MIATISQNQIRDNVSPKGRNFYEPRSEDLFDTYGEHHAENELYEESEVMKALDQLPMDKATKVKVCDLLLGYYSRWSTAAFAIGLHLGLSLMEQPGPRS